MAGHLPGFSITPAVAVGMGAAFVAVLKLPLSAVVVAALLTSKAGPGAEPLVIVGVVVAYVATAMVSRLGTVKPAVATGGEAAASQAPAAAVAPRSTSR
jgi:hypothetical protein